MALHSGCWLHLHCSTMWRDAPHHLMARDATVLPRSLALEYCVLNHLLLVCSHFQTHNQTRFALEVQMETSPFTKMVSTFSAWQKLTMNSLIGLASEKEPPVQRNHSDPPAGQWAVGKTSARAWYGTDRLAAMNWPVLTFILEALWHGLTGWNELIC